MLRYASALVLLFNAPLLGGCLPSTLRLDLSPMVDSGGRPGFEAVVSAGIGLALAHADRSHHFIQARYGMGGGYDGHTNSRIFTVGWDLDYLYWAEPSLDIRAGGRFVVRGVQENPTLVGAGLRLGLLPVVIGSSGGWVASQLCIGPELRLEHAWSDPPGSNRGFLALPLVIEVNFLQTSGLDDRH